MNRVNELPEGNELRTRFENGVKKTHYVNRAAYCRIFDVIEEALAEDITDRATITRRVRTALSKARMGGALIPLNILGWTGERVDIVMKWLGYRRVNRNGRVHYYAKTW